MTSAIDPTFVLSNRIEAALWVAIAGVMFALAIRRSAGRADCLVGAVAFALFGISDLVETTTGGWWRPWWLLAWKAACVLTFIVLLARHAKRKRAAAS